MSKILNIQAQVVISEKTGKRRILTNLIRDESLEVNFVLSAEEAEQWGAKLMFLAKECRKKNGQTEEVYQQKVQPKRMFLNKIKKLFTTK